MTGGQALRQAPGTAALTVAALGGVLAAAAGLTLLGIDTTGAMGPRFARLGALSPFNVHVLCGLLIPFAFFTQASVTLRWQRPRVWLGGAVAYAGLGAVSTATGWMLAAHTEPQLRYALRLSVLVLATAQTLAAYHFLAGDWFRYRLWVVRSSLGLLLQLTNRLCMATLFAATGDEPFASTAGYWTAVLVAVLFLEWVLVPSAVWRAEPPRPSWSALPRLAVPDDGAGTPP